ncbi:MAG: hypothetical protein NUV35_09895, partial [Syntrophomonadaceae bacterium]|nr:hypothetical protein [Syntrophomonadaceae bacterium]
MIRRVLVMLTAVALLAAGLVLPPAPAQALDPTLSYDLVANADQADWSNGRVALPFPGSTSDSRGFACHRERVRLENGTTAARVLETHPEWVSGGYILGEYPEMTLAEGTSF